jgi:hypothetical protein
MGYQLWTSETTGYRRKGTKLAELLEVFGHGAVTHAIAEPLLCAAAKQMGEDVRKVLLSRGFDVAGVKDSEIGPVIGMVITEQLTSGYVQDQLVEIEKDDLLKIDVPVGELLRFLRYKKRAFIQENSQIRAIVTHADLNKPPIRLYLFGLISLMEMHLQFWIMAQFGKDSWMSRLSNRRLELAKKLHVERQEVDEGISLIDCLQFCDKTSLIVKDQKLLLDLNLGSKTKARELFAAAERLRNDLAHSQLDLAHGTSWELILQCVDAIESLVHRSDQIIEEQADTVREGYRDGLWVA